VENSLDGLGSIASRGLVRVMRRCLDEDIFESGGTGKVHEFHRRFEPRGEQL
jgi:hypothetical protein